MLVSTALELLPSQFNKEFFKCCKVSSDTILAASVWIASDCFFYSDQQLTHTESLY